MALVFLTVLDEFSEKNMAVPIETLLSFSTATLKKLGFFQTQFSGVLQWQHGNQVTNRVRVVVYLNCNPPKIHLLYQAGNAHSIADEIRLKYVPSNLGRGGYWLFLCPQTGKPCRKLYLYNRHFKSRAALPPTILYRCQSITLSFRPFQRFISLLYDIEEQEARYQQRYVKTRYNGKLTRWALKISRADKRLAQMTLTRL